MGKAVKVLFEDNHLIVVQKSPGVLSQADKSGSLDVVTYLRTYLKTRYTKPGNVFVGLVHRLDRNVGGVMVFTKTSKGASRLSEQLRDGGISKVYLAIVEGVSIPESDILVSYLIKNRTTNKVEVYTTKIQGSKRADLSYKKLAVAEGRTLLRITLQTGRSHQIRAQLASYGFPLVGDGKYGRSPAGEIALWSYQLTFKHPTLDKKLTFSSFPEVEQAPWLAFRKTIQAMQRVQK